MPEKQYAVRQVRLFNEAGTYVGIGYIMPELAGDGKLLFSLAAPPEVVGTDTPAQSNETTDSSD